MDSFDADCLIYAAVPDHPLGRKIGALFRSAQDIVGLGSVLLVPEILSKPLRDNRYSELDQLQYLLSRLELHTVDPALAFLAATLGSRYRLRAADAIHLATAVHFGADRFITNNRRDFRRGEVTEVDVTYPDDF